MKKLTGLVIVAVVVGLAAYDMWAFMKGGTEVTVSHTIFMWSYKFPPFTFAFGFLCGHFFWRIRDTKETAEITKHD